MKLKSYSKINLSLRVLNKLKNGMHNIETNSTLVKLSDEIDIKKDKKDKILFTGKFKDQINLKKNTVKDTLRLLKKIRLLKASIRLPLKRTSLFMQDLEVEQVTLIVLQSIFLIID